MVINSSVIVMLIFLHNYAIMALINLFHTSLSTKRLYTIEKVGVALLKMLQQYTGALTGPKLSALLLGHICELLIINYVTTW